QGDSARAKWHCLEILALSKETGSPIAITFAIFAFGLAASYGEQPGRGVRLLTVTEVMLNQRGFKASESDVVTKVFRQALEKSRAQLGPAAFQAAQAEGQQMTIGDALALMTEIEREDSQHPEAGIG